MIQFSKLRLHGFKSFVERTELEICPGLNGIVGPNGCGKSNLVEALRWSMGENSSKRMRGGSGSMDDVIFTGTAKRPARNIAEVSVILDNSKRTAPAPFNNSDEIEVVRRIERDKGSLYKINGKTVRARDVQLLYADCLSGANSPYLVSQGRITEIIQAKPSERRRFLEDAAGISGLYARRHEAELRLKATDRNLNRLQDLLGSMESRLKDLQKQARQAHKYRQLSEQIRKLEVQIAVLEWQRAHANLQQVQQSFGQAESEVAEHMLVVSQLTKTQNVQAGDLPDLRKAEAESSAALQTKKLALQRLEDEDTRLSKELNEAKEQLAQIIRDRAHEQETLEENSTTLTRLEEEEKALIARSGSEDEELNHLDEHREALQSETDALEQSYNALMEQTASDKARKQSLEHQVAQDQQRRDTISDRLATVTRQLAEEFGAEEENNQASLLREEVNSAEDEAETLRARIAEAEVQLENLRQQQDQQRDALNQAQNRKSEILSEIKSLEEVVKSYSEEGVRPVFDDIETDEGFELALSRALGDTLMASANRDAPVIWTTRPAEGLTLPGLPQGARPLAPHVKAPEALALALSQIGLVETEEQGHKLAAKLLPGQALVSPQGAYWRWDGLQIKVTASDRHAIQLRQKNRLTELNKAKPEAEKAAETLREQIEAQRQDYHQAKDQLKETKQQLHELGFTLKQKRRELEEAVSQKSRRETAKAKLEETKRLAETDLAVLSERLTESVQALKGFDDTTLSEAQDRAAQVKEELSEMREKLHTAIRKYEASRQEHSRRQARLQAIGDERINLQNRCIRARERLKELDSREESLTAKVAELQKRPAVITQESEALLSVISEREKEKNEIADKLAQCESALAETTKALKEAESALATARESRVHAQATASERQNQLAEIKQHIAETFDITPEELAAQARIPDMDEPGATQTVNIKALKEDKDKAVRSRDLIGPVNLRAEQEAEALQKELGGVLEEKADLEAAIDELRQGIQKLNREARDRLQAAFTHVNGHFRHMFSRLFKGGNAHLALIESDDPLEAGLEIYAQPPGKTLQSLSLLSGGEQTLTAIALIFAMFLTNPAPICVLDEVDAPLDDANVDRFCDLLEEFADRGETRFILITHHRLTMARMDRLYGVTMAEKGISKLVSVDLNRQFDFLEAAE